MIKNIHLSALGLSIACLLTVTGCDMFGSKDKTTADKTKDTSGQTATTKKAPVNVDEVCTDTNIPKNLEKSLKGKLVQQGTAFAVTQDSGVKLDKDKLTAGSDKIAVSISDVKAVEGAKVSENGLVSCQANVSLELPEDMVNRANKVYKANNQNDDVLDANIIKDEAFAFTVNTNVKEDNVQLLGQSALLGVVSNTLANSSLKDQGNTSTNNAPVASKQNIAPTVNKTSSSEAKKRAQEKALAKKRAQEKALAKKRAQEKALAKKQAQEKALAKKQAQEKAKKQQETVAKKPAQAKPQQQTVVNKTGNENLAIKAQRAKEGITDTKQLKQKLSVETPKKTQATEPVSPATAPSKPFGVKNADNIEVVIVEENGTY